MNTSGGIINTLFALVFAVVLIALIWGIIMYYAEIGSEESKKENKNIIIGSITWLFLLMCVFAIIDWLRALV